MVLVAFWLDPAAGNDGGLRIDVHDSAPGQWRLLHGALRSQARQRARALTVSEYFLAWGSPPLGPRSAFSLCMSSIRSAAVGGNSCWTRD